MESASERSKRRRSDNLRHSEAAQREQSAVRMKKLRQQKRAAEVEAKGNAKKKQKLASECESSKNDVPFWKQKLPLSLKSLDGNASTLSIR